MTSISPVECATALFFLLTVAALAFGALHAMFSLDLEEEPSA